MRMDCPKCGGCGNVEMPEHLNAVMEILAAIGPASASDLLDHEPLSRISHSLLLNRLRALMALNMVQRKARTHETGDRIRMEGHKEMKCNSPLTEEHIKEVCRMGCGAECCRYLVMGDWGMTCAKHMPSFKALLDGRVAEGSICAQGDNCEGKVHPT